MSNSRNSMLYTNQTLIKAKMLTWKVTAAVLRLGLPQGCPDIPHVIYNSRS